MNVQENEITETHIYLKRNNIMAYTGRLYPYSIRRNRVNVQRNIPFTVAINLKEHEYNISFEDRNGYIDTK